MPTHDELEGMTRAELDDVATSLGLNPSDYSTKAEVIAAIDEVVEKIESEQTRRRSTSDWLETVHS